MNHVFDQLKSTFSSVGAEYLYARLHEPCFDLAERQAFDEFVRTLDTHEVAREQVAKNDFNCVADFICASSDKSLSDMWMCIPREAIARAQRMAEGFETTRKWGKY